MPHLAAAKAAADPCVVLEIPRIALDIDTIEDLLELAHAPGQKSSQLLARDLISAMEHSLKPILAG